jgi:3-hydroxybutyryl-CoA dehydratase
MNTAITERSSFTVGEQASLEKNFTQTDVDAFSRISGDVNPVHVNEAYAASTRFGGRIVHGSLVASLISAVLGTKLPGPGSIYVRQSLKFRAPVYPGDSLKVVVTVTTWDDVKGRVTLHTEVLKGETVVLSGEAELVMSSFLK